MKVGLPRTTTRASRRSTGLFPTANWQEREVYDFFGIDVRRPSRPAPDPAARRLGGPPPAQGLTRSAAWTPGTRARSSRPPTRRTTMSRRARRLASPRPTKPAAPRGHAGHQHGAAAPLDARRAPAAARARRRDRRRRARRSSATCTPASRRTPSTARGSRASRSSRARTTSRRSSTRSRTASPSRRCSGSRRRRARRRIRVLFCELNRIASHLVWLATSGHGARRDLGDAVRVPRARGDPRHLRAHHRPADEPRVHPDRRPGRWTCRDGGARPDPASSSTRCPGRIRRVRDPALASNPIWLERNKGVGILTADRRARARRHRTDAPRRAASPTTSASDEPYCGYENYDFDVPTRRGGDCYARYEVRIAGDARVAEDRRAGARSAARPGP